jgi:hypothetical protein
MTKTSRLLTSFVYTLLELQYFSLFVPLYTHTHIHTYIHTDRHTYIHTYIQTYIHTYIVFYACFLNDFYESLKTVLSETKRTGVFGTTFPVGGFRLDTTNYVTSFTECWNYKYAEIYTTARSSFSFVPSG